jgi:DNA polymerase-3 subunit chi
MTRVDFHTGVDDSVHFACRLLRKAYRQGLSVLVTAPAATLDALDRELWTFEAHEFVPHLRLRPDQGVERMKQHTPIWLAEGAATNPCPEVLVNLGAPIQADLGPFTRVVEIVATQDDSVRAGRSRWRDYERRGLAIKHHAAAKSP